MEVTDATRGRAIVERWCVLAEQRLEYLTELFESGRWRRFFTETAFLENIQEAKAAVDTWRDLLYREATVDNHPVDLSWLGHTKDLAPRPIFYLSDAAAAEPTRVFNIIPPPAAPEPVELYSVSLPAADAEIDDPSPSSETAELHLSIVPAELHAIEPQAEEPAPDAPPPWQHALDIAVLAERYPLLRRAG